MTALKERIAALIAAAGPLSVADYFALCLSDPQHGYYMRRDPFGRAGDFTTAPEISQMFGELVGVWLVAAWRALGRPARPLIAEIGPGRGTLAKDILRTLEKIEPELPASAGLALIEISPRLHEIQADSLRDYAGRIEWHAEIGDLPRRPLLIVGNEFFDALPVRQFVKAGRGWRERAIGLDDGGQLAFVSGTASLDPALLPPGADAAPDGTIFETAPVRAAVMQAIATRIAADGGAGLFIDYGHLDPGFGDTFQAVRNHRPEDVLENPGEADVTAHVDFSALAAVVQAVGLDASLATQGEFLLGLGLLERAGRLGAGADETIRDGISAAVERLAASDQMGGLFKVLAVVPRNLRIPPFDRH